METLKLKKKKKDFQIYIGRSANCLSNFQGYLFWRFLGLELRALCLLGNCSTTWPMPAAPFG
jgi:hypothetical protein